MQKVDIRVDVTEAVGTGETLEVAMTVILPPPDLPPPTMAMFGFPGGSPSVSASGVENGIVWILEAFDIGIIAPVLFIIRNLHSCHLQIN